MLLRAPGACPHLSHPSHFLNVGPQPQGFEPLCLGARAVVWQDRPLAQQGGG